MDRFLLYRPLDLGLAYSMTYVSVTEIYQVIYSIIKKQKYNSIYTKKISANWIL